MGRWWVSLAMTVAAGVTIADAAEPRLFVDGSWASILASRAGRPVIVDFWGIGCGSCQAEMAAWGRLLARRHDFDFVTVNTGIVGTPKQAADLLAAAGVSPKTAWRFANGFDTTLYRQVDPTWRYEIPTTVLIDREGHATRLDLSTDLGGVEAWLDREAAR